MSEPTIRVELRLESCFDFVRRMPDCSADLVLIDPPYEVSRKTGFANGGSVERLRVSMDFGAWDKNFTGLDEIIREAYRVLRPSGTLICFYDLWKVTVLRDYFERARFKQLRFIEWLKTNPVPLNSKINYLTNAREIAVSGVKESKPVFHAEYHNGIYQYPICHEKNRFHPTQKPLALLMELVNTHSNPGDTVVDFFSGSGTTASACIRTGRHFCGCEINAEYYHGSLRRLREEPHVFCLTGVDEYGGKTQITGGTV